MGYGRDAARAICAYVLIGSASAARLATLELGIVFATLEGAGLVAGLSKAGYRRAKRKSYYLFAEEPIHRETEDGYVTITEDDSIRYYAAYVRDADAAFHTLVVKVGAAECKVGISVDENGNVTIGLLKRHVTISVVEGKLSKKELTDHNRKVLWTREFKVPVKDGDREVPEPFVGAARDDDAPNDKRIDILYVPGVGSVCLDRFDRYVSKLVIFSKDLREGAYALMGKAHRIDVPDDERPHVYDMNIWWK